MNKSIFINGTPLNQTRTTTDTVSMQPDPEKTYCTCFLIAAGYRESWAVKHTRLCGYTEWRNSLQVNRNQP